ncbi:DEAD/DEAH box helicase [Simiduia curdlanivorans]|uniref:ATP-dependent RNA helicase RhlE n=1 Tax=Simiduia curdlanivorans TaxID=1492769 RepID=A0ABV8V7N7_9GAMM|nr:DEAD/DEAH box helicase [Simiduia curdlanivorans]MDN3640730.1 DEAD/DEAH box helicase [Simiduia curdlanivorans]
MRFADLGLSAPILEAVAEQGYETPSPIQVQAIPAVIAGKDVMAAAQTGTGKTAGFTLPILERLIKGNRAPANHVRVLVLTPTRELAAQVGESVANYGKHLPLRSAVVFGGVSINPQMMQLRKGVDVLVATPGRLLDLYSQNAVKFSHLEMLVLDEADRMLDMGFIHDIKRILKLLPDRRQNLLFSATFSDEIRTLAKGLVHNPVEIDVAPRNTTVETVKQWLSPVDKGKKTALLIHLVKQHNWHQVLVFSRTKHGANKIAKQLEDAGINSAAIHGNKSQNARTKALAEFKTNKVRVLVATDIAARGIDIDQLPQVVNFDLPNVPEDYVHRIGRTGRAGASGQAVSLVSADEIKQLQDIERLIQQVIEREVVPGFEAANAVPETKLNTRPFKPKKPKAPKTEHRDGYRASGSAKKTGGRSSDSGRNNGPSRNASNKPSATKTAAGKPSNGPRRSPKPTASGNR